MVSSVYVLFYDLLLTIFVQFGNVAILLSQNLPPSPQWAERIAGTDERAAGITRESLARGWSNLLRPKQSVDFLRQ